MLTFTISKALSEAVALDPSPRPLPNSPGLHWWAHWVPVLDQGCALLMHEQTRYCMVFFELNDAPAKGFAPLFVHRLHREVLAICQPMHSVSERLHTTIDLSCRPYQFRVSLDYTASADLFDAAQILQNLMSELGRYPVPGMTEFTLGIKLNQRLAERRQQNPKTALDSFRQFWLDLSVVGLSKRADLS